MLAVRARFEKLQYNKYFLIGTSYASSKFEIREATQAASQMQTFAK